MRRLFCLLALPACLGAAGLVPDTPSTVPNYFCTWNLQGLVASYAPGNAQADAMTEANLFGEGPRRNWVGMYPAARRGLILVLDDTWDIPLTRGPDRGHPLRGSLELDTERFPSYQGTPAQRLARLNRDVQARGWRSVGLWGHAGRATESECAVTGFGQASNLEERLEVKTVADGSVQLKRVSLPYPETLSFVPAK